MKQNSTSNLPPGQPPDGDTLDLSSIPGVRNHFDQTGTIPILVFRTARAIRIVIDPFPGVWRMFTPTKSRCLLAGSNTFDRAFQVEAGGEVSIVPIMSATVHEGPRVQVPAPLTSDLGMVEADDEEDLDPLSDSLEPLDSLLEVSEGDLEPDGAEFLDIAGALEEDLDDDTPTVRIEPESEGSDQSSLSCDWFVISHVGGAA